MNKSFAIRKQFSTLCHRPAVTKGLLMLLVLPLWLFTVESEAARITFEPNDLTVTAAPGDVVTVPVNVSLADTSLQNAYASFSLSQINGNLDRTWINSQIYISLNSWYKSRQAMFQLRIPKDAQQGTYHGVFRTVWLRSNEQVVPEDLLINVDVGTDVACSQAPLFSEIVSTKESMNVRNNKLVSIDLSGSVSTVEGCDLIGTSYRLIDEYGELDETRALSLNDDGSFTVAVPLVASRLGSDRDGRLYTITFFAENSAGVGESTETNIFVTHDNRKK